MGKKGLCATPKPKYFFLKLCILDFFCQLILKKAEKNPGCSGQLKHSNESSLAFLDVLVMPTPEGSLKPQCSKNQRIPAKPIFFLPPSTSTKPWRSRALFYGAENIIKKDELKKDEIRAINNTLTTNGYPRFHCKQRPARSESESQQTKIMTVVPYVQNLT